MTTPRITHVTSDGRRVTWHCSTCDNPLRPVSGGGWIELVGEQMRAAETCRRREAELEARAPRIGGMVVYTGADLLDLPAPGRWRATCAACNGGEQGSGYFISVERIDTVAAVLHWSAHLSGKWWPAYTDWGDVCRIVAEVAMWRAAA